MALYRSLPDAELAVLFHEGDRSAFAEIYDRYFGLLYIHAYNRLRDKSEAQDIVQELFAYLWSKCRELDLKNNLSNYLYTSTRNRVINLIARKQVARRHLLSLPGFIDNMQTDYRLRERQLADIIEKEIRQLPPKMREVFEMSRKANMTYKEIAAELNITEQSVRSHVKNALKILRVKLGLLLYLAMIFCK